MDALLTAINQGLNILSAAPSFADKLYSNLIDKGRYMYFLEGLSLTIRITFGAVILGIIVGTLVAVIRVSGMNSKNIFIKILGAVCKIYVAIIRGTPVMVQLLIFAFVVFGQSSIDRVWVAIIAFGVNSGAYVSETMRAGIMAVDRGQTEAGRSLGLGTFDTYRYIVLPQAFKNVLPPLGNECIMLLKETSLVSAIAMADLTRAYTKVAQQTYNFAIPLFAIAVVYFLIVMLMSYGIGRLERWLRKSDHR